MKVMQAVCARPAISNEMMINKSANFHFAGLWPIIVFSSPGKGLDCVIPKLVALVGSLSTDQQKSFQGIFGKAAVGASVDMPKKRAKLHQEQPAGSLDTDFA
jgi:hypothetical protein